MVEQIIFNCKIDFDIGLQLGEEKIALTKPNDTHRGIERWVTNSVITKPFIGFVFVDNNVKKVFRIEEAVKILKPDPYSNREHHQYAERNRVCPNGPRRANSSSHQCLEGLSKTYHSDAHHSEK